jgi:dihydroorotate dehydrogenase (fumarate)
MPLATRYLGLYLRSPFIVGSSPLCDEPGMARQLQDAGAGAVVMRSLFMEQFGTGPAPDWQTGGADYHHTPEGYLRHLAALKKRLAIPVIASLNGCRRGAWMEVAPLLEKAGADAIELNFYHVVTRADVAADQVELEMLEIVRELTEIVRIPVAVKLSPYHAAVAQLAVALELEGASGLVIFNRFYQPDVDIDAMEVRPTLHLSDSSELLLRLRWLAILSPQISGSLAVSGGVHAAEDVIKALLTGAHAVQVVSAILQYGPEILASLHEGLETWMGVHGFTGLAEFRGLLDLHRCPDPDAFERANYIRALNARSY